MSAWNRGEKVSEYTGAMREMTRDELLSRYDSLMKEAMGMRVALSMIAYNEAPVENIGLASKNISKSAIASFAKFLKEGI